MSRIKGIIACWHNLSSPKADIETQFGVSNVYQKLTFVKGREEKYIWQRKKLNCNVYPRKPGQTSREPQQSELDLYSSPSSVTECRLLWEGCEPELGGCKNLTKRGPLQPTCPQLENNPSLKMALTVSLHLTHISIDKEKNCTIQLNIYSSSRKFNHSKLRGSSLYRLFHKRIRKHHT